jgi:hypothetical protein
MSTGDLRSVKPAGSGDPRRAPDETRGRSSGGVGRPAPSARRYTRQAPDDTRAERPTRPAPSARRHTRRAPDETRAERPTTHAPACSRSTWPCCKARPPAGARCSLLSATRGSSSALGSAGTCAERRPLTKRKALVLKRSNGIAYHARARNELKYWSPSCALLSKATSGSCGHNARHAARSADAQPRPIRCLARSLPGAEPYCERKQACGRWSLDGGGGMRPLLSC